MSFQVYGEISNEDVYELNEGVVMTSLQTIIIIAILLLLTGGVVKSLNFLLWIGVLFLVIAGVSYLFR